MTFFHSRDRSATDRWIQTAIALVVTASYGWDAWIGINAYFNYALGSLTGIVWDLAVIALCIFLVRGWTFAQLTIALVALAGLETRWPILTSTWFWMPHMDGRRTLVLMTTAANALTLVLLAVPLLWHYSNRAIATLVRRAA